MRVGGEWAQSALMRIAFIGDVGGHRDLLAAALSELGASPDGTLPPDLAVVQVGDLVHRGPDSPGVVDLVDRFLERVPERWVQLIGNHEAHYLAPPMFTFPERLPPATEGTLRRWLDAGTLHAAVAVKCDELGETVATHAGVTSGFWAERGRRDAAGTAEEANRLLRERRWGALCEAGCMLQGRFPNAAAGPIWAEAGSETRQSWVGLELPFSQVHGHSTPFVWSNRRWLAPDAVRAASRLDRDRRHVWTELTGGSIVGVDPSHGRYGAPRWAPLVVEGELVAHR